MAQKRIESFFAPAPRQTATVVQGKLALPGSWRMPRLHDTWRRGLCGTITCTAAPRVWHFSALHHQMNWYYIIIIAMFVPFTLFHVDRHLKRLDNHCQYSVEQIGSDCTRIDLRASVFQKFSGEGGGGVACPRTPLPSSGFARTFALRAKHSAGQPP